MKRLLASVVILCLIITYVCAMPLVAHANEKSILNASTVNEQYYPVTFIDWDHTVISSKTYKLGDPIDVPADPVRAGNNIYCYTFYGWTKVQEGEEGPELPEEPLGDNSQDIGVCTGACTYIATYVQDYVDYTVVFRYDNGDIIAAQTYHWGDTVTPPVAPAAPAGYTFVGWTPEITVCQGNAVYTAVFEQIVPSVEWVSASTTLGGNIGLNFYVKLADELVNDPTTFVRFTTAGRTMDVPLSEALESVKDGVVRYRFTCPLNAKNMTDEVVAQVMTADGAVGKTLSMNVAKYCNYMIQYGGNAKLADLMKAMLNYGAAAQVLFGYNTGNLANAALSEEDKVLAEVDASAYASKITGSEEGIAIASATLMLETETSVRIYFKLTGDKTIDQYRFFVDNVAVQPIEKDGKFYVEIKDIAAQDLDARHTITVGGLTIEYSGLSYVNTVINYPASAGEALVNAAKAIFSYNRKAEAYFN